MPGAVAVTFQTRRVPGILTPLLCKLKLLIPSRRAPASQCLNYLPARGDRSGESRLPPAQLLPATDEGSAGKGPSARSSHLPKAPLSARAAVSMGVSQ